MRALGVGLLAVALALLPAAPLPGCRLAKRVRAWFRPAEEVELARADGEPPAPLSGSEAVRASSFAPEGDRSGLEVRLMVVDDTRYDAPRLLEELMRSPAAPRDGSAPGEGEIDEPTRRRWAAWGFRLIPVPAEAVEPLLDALTPVLPSSVQWLGEFGAWRPIVRAGRLPDTRVRVGDSFVRVGAGRPTLIARSWVEPVLNDSGVGSALRLDLGMQMQQNARPDSGFFDPTREPNIEDSGPVLDPLLTSLSLPPGRALVIVAEAPGVSWDELPEPAPVGEAWATADESSGGDGLGPRPGEASGPARAPATGEERTASPPRPALGGIEPRAPQPPSLGELMLMTEGSRIVRLNEARVLPKRVIVVLVPYIRGPYRLLPPVSASAGGEP